MSKYDVERSALLKVVLHAARFPTAAVNGVLLGKVGERAPQASPPSSPRGQAGSVVHIYDAIPLCHNFITLTPVLEAALAQVEERVKLLGDGTSIVGYYQCNERLDDRELGAQGRRITERLDALHPGAAGLVLDAAALQALLQQGAGAAAPAAPLVLLSARAAGSGQWGQVPAAAVACPSAGVGSLVRGYLAEGRHRRLVDFEDHLDDITRDWLNPTLLE